jgi:hypothetical protein
MQRQLPLLLIIALLIAFRVFGSFFGDALPNFQPLAAVFFCGSILAKGWRGYLIPLGIWLVTYPLGTGPIIDPVTFLTTLVGFSAIYFFGKSFTLKKPLVMVGGSLFAAVAFHLITNSTLWLSEPIYAKTLNGLWQSLWAGPPHSALPSWVFLRNLMAANALFTGIFILAQHQLPQLAIRLTTPKLNQA